MCLGKWAYSCWGWQRQKKTLSSFPFKSGEIKSLTLGFFLNPLCAEGCWLEQQPKLYSLKHTATLEKSSLCPVASGQLQPNNLIQSRLWGSPGQQHLHGEHQPCENFACSFER